MSIDLSALADLTENYDVEKKYNNVEMIKLSKINPDPQQPRKNFDEQSLKELADSIERDGLIQPIIVRKENRSYTIVTGERRFRALQLTGVSEIACIVRNDIKKEDIPYVQMAENLKRQDLSIDELAAFIDSRLQAGENQKDIAKKLGFSKSVLSQYAAWTSMPAEIQNAVKEGKVKSIQAAYALYQKYKKQPDEIVNFIEHNDYISVAEAQSFDKKQEKSVQNTGERDASNYDKSFYVETFKDSTSQENNELEDKDFSENDEEEVSEQQGKQKMPEAESPDDFDSVEDYFDEPESKKTSIFSEEDKVARDFKKPTWLCKYDGRDCELLYKKRPDNDGYAWIKYEDGSEDQVLAENVQLNRVVEG